VLDREEKRREIMYPPRRSGFGQVPPNLRGRLRPGGGYAFGPAPVSLSGLSGFFGECVPAPLILTGPPAIAHAVRSNAANASLLGWGPLRDQIEVNHVGCARANPRLSEPDFAQAIAQFQRARGLPQDGILGAAVWTAMKAMVVEREPFPRNALTNGFDTTALPGACEAAVHPAIDVGVAAGTPIPVVADGVVIYAGPVGTIRDCPTAITCQNGTGTAAVCNPVSYGRAVVVEHPDRGPNVGGTRQSVYTIYAHVQFVGSHAVASGEPVQAGRIIGEVGAGCVGFSSGPHLHYAVVTGPRAFRMRSAGPARCELCARAYCASASCPRCDFDHLWDLVTPRRPRTTAAGAGFAW
jgi:murein DD-endopeptidase MepM/ murein hydrolase activator NlpD